MHDHCKIVIFDGACNLCNAGVNHIINRDAEGLFSFTPLQSDIAQELIEKYHEPEYGFDTLLLIKNGVCFERSDAVLEIMKELSGCGFRYRILKLTPKPVRDSLYNLIARNRYRLFGRRDRCMMPAKDVQKRFLE